MLTVELIYDTDFDYGDTVTHEAEIRYVDVTKGWTITFPLGGRGYRDWGKIVCMRKNAIVCPRGASEKKLSAETIYVMQDLGNLKKNCLHNLSGGKKTCKHSIIINRNQFDS